MTNRIRFAVALFATLSAAPALAAPAAKETGPAMWIISDADTKIYLFGTFHILPKDVKWQTEAVKNAITEATVVAVETDTESAYAKASIGAMLLEHGVNPSWQTLRGVLGGERYTKLDAIAKRYGVEMTKLQSYRPWLVMMMLSDKVMQANGFSRDFGVERIVLAEALEQKDKILTMETPEAQIKALAAMDTPAALDSFDVTIAELGDLKTKVEPLLTAWRTGDVEGIDRLSGVEMRRDAPAAYRALLVNRNANWIERLQGWMKGKGTYFVAVGAAHLAGPDSVLVMLEKRGVKATRVQ